MMEESRAEFERKAKKLAKSIADRFVVVAKKPNGDVVFGLRRDGGPEVARKQTLH